MRCFNCSALSLSRLTLTVTLLGTALTVAHAQTSVPTPAQEPIPAPGKETLPAAPTKPSDIERAAELQMKPQFKRSEIKPVAPLFDPKKEHIFLADSTYRKPARFTVGAFFPNSTTLRDQNESVFLTLGASLDLPPHGPTRSSTLAVYFDSAFSSQDANSASLFGLGLGFRRYPGAKPGFTVVSPRFYYGAGGGVYYLRKETDNSTDDAFQPGAKAMVGFDFSEGWAIEASYTLTGKVSGANFSGPSVAFTYRF